METAIVQESDVIIKIMNTPKSNDVSARRTTIYIIYIYITHAAWISRINS